MKSSTTCGSRLVNARTGEAICLETDEDKRCIDVPINECRMKPIDSETGKVLERKFVVKPEGVEAKWWKENEH